MIASKGVDALPESFDPLIVANQQPESSYTGSTLKLIDAISVGVVRDRLQMGTFDEVPARRFQHQPQYHRDTW